MARRGLRRRNDRYAGRGVVGRGGGGDGRTKKGGPRSEEESDLQENVKGRCRNWLLLTFQPAPRISRVCQTSWT